MTIKATIEQSILNSTHWKDEETTVGDVTKLVKDLYEDLVIHGHIEQSFMGYATTGELLQELSTRMRTTQNSTAGIELGRMCDDARKNLAVGVINYRTVDPQ